VLFVSELHNIIIYPKTTKFIDMKTTNPKLFVVTKKE